MHSNSNTIGDITFYVIISLSLLGTIISLFLCEPKALKRSDGSPVSLPQIPTWKSEMLDLFETPKQDVYIVLFFPMFFCLEFLLPLSVQHVQSRSVQYPHTLLEQHNVLACRNRGLVPCRICSELDPHTALSAGVHCCWDAVCLGVVVWTGAYVWQRKESSMIESGVTKKDFTDSDYAGPLLLYLSFGFLVAV
jgi:hypothetical protein